MPCSSCLPASVLDQPESLREYKRQRAEKTRNAIRQLAEESRYLLDFPAPRNDSSSSSPVLKTPHKKTRKLEEHDLSDPLASKNSQVSLGQSSQESLDQLKGLKPSQKPI
jgi:hypothetical protein